MRHLREILPSPLRVLAVRSLVLAALWWLGKASLSLGLAAPFWLFVLASLYMFLFPVFGQRKLLAPFLFFLAFAFFFPGGLLTAIALAILFFLIMGIKDLLFVDRGVAYAEVSILILFLLSLAVYGSAREWGSTASVWMPILAGVAYMLAVRDLPWKDAPHPGDVVPLIGGFLVAEVYWALLFLPMDWTYQAAMLFMFMILLSDLQMKFRKGGLSNRYILSAFLPFAVLMGAILTLNSWGI